MKNDHKKTEDFCAGWEFFLSEENSIIPEAEEHEWQTVSLPHDWSMERGYDLERSDGATGMVTGGVGWYRKHFQLSAEPGGSVYLVFDGIYNRCEIQVNGHLVKSHPYGYSPFFTDLAPFLNRQINTILIKVDRRRYVDSRWYTGSGIYRPVRLVRAPGIHVPVWGDFVFCDPVSPEYAVIHTRHDVRNGTEHKSRCAYQVEILDPQNKTAASAEGRFEIATGNTQTVQTRIEIPNPALWNLDSPAMYTARFRLSFGDDLTDMTDTRFGIRDIRFDAEKGFFLNGQNTKIKGVCLHHDGGLTGSAVPPDIWRRRLVKLKKMGCNAIRSAHNPASDELLTLCDEMGILVQDEFFDEWEHPKDKRLNTNEKHDDFLSRGSSEYFLSHAESDLKDTVRCHRNHPSVFQWSIGNEIEWTYPQMAESTGFFDANASGNYFWNPPPKSRQEIRRYLEEHSDEKYDTGRTAKQLASWVRETDRTRPVTANCILPSASFESGYTDALDIVGFSYRRVMYDYSRQHYPDKVIMGTENLGQWHEWKAAAERDFVSGIFVWTGIDYLGEAHGKKNGAKGTPSGFLDLAGFEKPSYYMFQSLWRSEPVIRLFTQKEELSLFENRRGNICEKQPGGWEKRLWHWQKVNSHWNYSPGEPIIAEAYSNCPEAELFLNGHSLGVRFLKDFPDRIYKWALPYESGEMTVQGRGSGAPVNHRIVSAKSARRVAADCDREYLAAGTRNCVHVCIQLKDEHGVPVSWQEQEVSFSVSGPVRILGADNGSVDNLTNHSLLKLMTFQGRAILILQSGSKTGAADIRIGGNGLIPAEIRIPVR